MENAPSHSPAKGGQVPDLAFRLFSNNRWKGKYCQYLQLFGKNPAQTLPFRFSLAVIYAIIIRRPF